MEWYFKLNQFYLSRSKKDPGVPNMCPFKEKVLEEAEEARQRKIDEKQKRRERLKQLRKEGKDKALEEKRSNVRISYLLFLFMPSSFRQCGIRIGTILESRWRIPHHLY